MSARSKTATIAGVLFLITEVPAIAGLALYQPALTDAGHVTEAGSDGRILLGVVCELILVVAVIGTSVTLFPVIKREHEGIALWHVARRLLEAAVITVGLVSMLALVTLRQAGAVPGGSADAVLVVGQALVAFHNWEVSLAIYLIAKGFRSAPADEAVASPADYPARRLAGAVQGEQPKTATVVGVRLYVGASLSSAKDDQP